MAGAKEIPEFADSHKRTCFHHRDTKKYQRLNGTRIYADDRGSMQILLSQKAVSCRYPRKSDLIRVQPLFDQYLFPGSRSKRKITEQQ